MNNLEQAIKDAVEKGGYNDIAGWFDCEGRESEHRLLDPAFWSALGKARGWDGNHCDNCGKQPDSWLISNPAQCPDCYHAGKRGNPAEPIKFWHRLIDHLAEGKDVESFFASL